MTPTYEKPIARAPCVMRDEPGSHLAAGPCTELLRQVTHRVSKVALAHRLSRCQIMRNLQAEGGLRSENAVLKMLKEIMLTSFSLHDTSV